jgi:hypothetical protein
MALSSACGSAPTQQEPSASTSAAAPRQLFAHWPPAANEFRFHWSAVAGVDLTTAPAVALRAYLESYGLSGYTNGDPSALYPGFLRATPENPQQDNKMGQLQQLGYIRPLSRAQLEALEPRYRERYSIAGYQPTHILELRPEGDGYRATVCVGLYAAYRTFNRDGTKYYAIVADRKTGEPVSDPTTLVQVLRVELTDRDPRVGDAPAGPDTPQTGPLPAPVGDVFGRWFITGMSTNTWGPLGQTERIDTPEVRQQCEDAMPDDAATRTAMANGFHDQPPPHGDPIPGWPDAPN